MEYRIDSIITDGKFSGFLLQLWEPGTSQAHDAKYAWKINMKFQTKSDAIAYANSVNPYADQSSQAA